MGQGRFYFESGGAWSGGGRAFLGNAQFAQRRHAILQGAPGRDIPIIPRNVPQGGVARRPYVLAPQNAWPYTRIVPRGTAAFRWTALAVASRLSTSRAHGVLRIGSSIPRSGSHVSPVMPNVLDEGFEVALRASGAETQSGPRGSIVSVGSAHAYRNYETLIAAHRVYRAAGGERHLHIVGTGPAPEMARLRSLVGEDEAIHITAIAISRPECLALTRTADLIVFPSRVEASPFTLLEAMAVSSRILMSDIPGHRETAERYGPVPDSATFPPKDVEALASQLGGSPGSDLLSAQHDRLSTPAVREAYREQWGLDLATWLVGMPTVVNLDPRHGDAAGLE